MKDRPDPWEEILSKAKEPGPAPAAVACDKCGRPSAATMRTLFDSLLAGVSDAVRRQVEAVERLKRSRKKDRWKTAVHKVGVAHGGVGVLVETVMRLVTLEVGSEEARSAARRVSGLLKGGGLSGLGVGDVARQCSVEGCNVAAYGDPPVCPIHEGGSDE